jgi:hypothetical protein
MEQFPKLQALVREANLNSCKASQEIKGFRDDFITMSNRLNSFLA